MATTAKKEVVISTQRVNSYGARVITAGIDITQYQRNPILLYMHERWGRENMPIGLVENLRYDEDRLVGTPVFDMDDPDAAKIANKWNKGYLRMVSPSLEIIDTSTAPEMVLTGQTRATVTRCKLTEISVVDIGGNDDALQLQFEHNGKVLELANGGLCDVLPLLELNKEDPGKTGENQINNNFNNDEMKIILLALGLGENASSEQAVAAITALKEKAAKAETMQLAAITSAVDTAISARKITADQKEHFLNLGKAAGIENLNKTLEFMRPANKPTDVISAGKESIAGALELKWGDLTPDKAEELKTKEPQKYVQLYKAEFGCEPIMNV